MQAQIERGYETFTGRVAMGRKLPNDSVKAIAEGRVWTGEQALKIGLVDKLGNLNDAIKCAAKLAELKEYTTSNYPAAEPWYANLLNNKSTFRVPVRLVREIIMVHLRKSMLNQHSLTRK